MQHKNQERRSFHLDYVTLHSPEDTFFHLHGSIEQTISFERFVVIVADQNVQLLIVERANNAETQRAE